MKNPYTKRPAEGDDFVGRTSSYQILYRYLKENPSIIVVTGERGIGKTSFLRNLMHQRGLPLFFIEYRTEKELEQGFVIPDLHKTLDEKSKKVKDTLKSLVSKLDALRVKASIQGVPSFEIEKPSDAFSKTGDVKATYKTIGDIQHFLKEIKETVVVLVENAHNLLPAEQKILDMLVRSPNFFVILEVPTVEIDKIVIRDYKSINLKRLSRKESLTLIGKGEFLDADISERIYDVSEGNPYYIQSICWLLYEKLLAGDTISVSEFIDTLKGKKLRDRQDCIHCEILACLDKDARQLVMDLSIAPFLLTHKIIKIFSRVDNVDSALSTLVKKEILVGEELFWIYHSLFREFLRSEQRNKIATELEDIYVGAVRELKKEKDCILLLYELRENGNILSKVIPEIENEEILLDFGYEEFNLGRWRTARVCFETGLDLDGEMRSHFVGSLGILFYRAGEVDEALKYYGDALAIHREIGYKQGEASDLGNIGLCFSHSQRDRV
jgi:tetratricopeptide (TPR) repeat protein